MGEQIYYTKAEIIIAKGKYQAVKATKPAKAVASATKKKGGLSGGGKAAIGIAAAIVVLAGAFFAASRIIPKKENKPDEPTPVEQIEQDVPKENTAAENVTIEGISVGGMTQSEARLALTDALEARANDAIEVSITDQKVRLTGDDILKSADLDTACMKAFEAKAGETVALPLFEDGKVMGMLSQCARGLKAEKVDYSYVIEEDCLSITVGSNGQVVDIPKLGEAAVTAFMKGDKTLEAPVVTYQAEPLDIEALHNMVNVPAQDAYYDPQSHQIVDGVPGYDFDVAEVLDTIENGEPGKEYRFDLHVTEPAVKYDDVSKTLFNDTLYEYTSNLTNIPNRTANVKLAAAAINGTVLYPGDEFNFNKIVGERTEAKGYKAADVYVSGDTVPQVGGGICQVASTLYVCCLYSDLKITERTEHMYFVTYVPSGLDATIYWGSCNYRFVNDKNYPILIETSQSGLTLTVRLKGTKENDNYVKMLSETLSTDPFKVVNQVDESKAPGYSKVSVTGYTGYKVRTTRNVYSGDGTLLRSTVEATSNYKRRDKIIIVGPTAKPEEPPVEPVVDPVEDPPVEPPVVDPVVDPPVEPPVEPIPDPFSDPTEWDEGAGYIE